MKQNIMKRSLLDVLLRYRQVIIVTTVILITVGIVGLLQMPRDEFPEFKIRQGLIIGIYPGASSHQVEEQLTKKVENYLFQYEEVNKAKTYTISKENVMIVFVEVQKNVKEPKMFWTKLRHGLNELKGTLPSGVMSLTANDDFGNTSALLLAVESETKTYKELERYVERFEDGVRKIPSTSRVKHYGLQNEEINVYINDSKLTHYGIKPLVVFAALKPQGVVNYSGEIDDGKIVRPIHIPTGYKTENDIANQIVYSDPAGNVIRVKDVARVVREYPEPDSYIRLNGKKCLIISLEMMSGRNIVQYGDDVQKEIAKFRNEVPADVHVGVISDMPHFVSTSIYNFLKEFGISIIAVIFVIVLLLPRRVALVAASAIPISVLITIAILWVTEISLQTVSLAALIIVLGMVVDNAIVVIDDYLEKLDKGISPHDAASKSVTDLFGSLLSATLIIVMCFAPTMILMTGVAGDFIQSLPITIGYALFVSLLVSTIITPLMNYAFIKKGVKGEHSTGRKAAFLNWLQTSYEMILEFAFRRKAMVVFVGVATFVIGLLILGFSPQKTFPAFERNQFAVEVYLPTGSSLQQTDQVMKSVEKLLLKDKRVKEVASFVGTSSPRFQTLYAPNFPAKNYGQMLVITDSDEATREILDEYSPKYSDHIPNAYIRWKQLEMQPTAAAIEVRVSGDSISTIRQTAAQICDSIRTVEGVQWIRTDYQKPLQAVQLNLKRDEASRLGYSKQILDYSLMVGTKGFPVSTIWENDYPLSVNLKVDKKTKSAVSDIMNQYVTSPFLISSVQVRQLATAVPEWSEGEIVRRNGVRTLTIRVDCNRDAYSSIVFKKIQTKINSIQMPAGASLAYGGEYETSIDELTPLYYSLVIGIGIIFIILLVQFRTVKTAILIMMTLPLSVFGAAVGIIITGYPFGVTALIGIIGLIGIVVRNGIIYVSYAEELRNEHGHTLEEAALSAAKRRMRPIFLTSAAAAVGVVPMIISNSPLWGPLGAAICFGLIFAVVLSLLVMPVLYYLFHKSDFDKVEDEGEVL